MNKKTVFVTLLVALSLTHALFLIFNKNGLYSSEQVMKRRDFSIQLSHGLKKCTDRYTFPQILDARYRTENPRINLYLNSSTKPSDMNTAIKNAFLLDRDGLATSYPIDIYLADGIIYGLAKSGSKESMRLSQEISPRKIIDTKGRYVTPGLVEAHSHVGICTQPELHGVNDMFELMSPVTPFIRTLDAFNVGDPAIKLISYGGVTSSLVLPSANVISGEGFVFKMLVPPSLSAEEMLVEYNPKEISPNFDNHRQRWMKLACGENPKKRFVSNASAPKSRMGLGFLVRDTLTRAQKLKDSQDSWCNAVEQGLPPNSLEFPESVELSLLVDLLRGKVRTNAHCYETFDIETLLRHGREFGFEITAIHHALDAYKIPKIIKEQPNNITVVTFASEWGFKKEAFQGSVFGPKILNENEIPVALHTDHPAEGGHDLVLQAQRAHNFGLPAEKAFAAVTGTSAKLLGLDNRIGYLRKGYDADVVIWDRHPLQMGASPLKVFIDGVPVLDTPIKNNKDLEYSPDSMKEVTPEMKDFQCLEGSESFIVRGITKSLVSEQPKENNEPYELVVNNGTIICFKKNCTSFYDRIVSSCDKVLELQNGYISPGGTALSSTHGLMEMPSETTTGDGDIMDFIKDGVLDDFSDPDRVLLAHDGLQFESAHLKRAHNSGVLKIITPPFRSEGKKFLTGVSTCFRSSASGLEDIIKENVALHFTVGDMGKQALLPTVSSEILMLRKLLLDNSEKKNIYGQVFRGELPLAIHANNKDVILQLIQMKKQLGDIYMIIVGGIESHLIADKLAASDIPIILSPWRCQRRFWDERRCLTGLHQTPTIIGVLKRAGVRFGIAVDDDKLVRFLFDEAGMAASRSNISDAEAVRAISTDIDNIFNVSTSNTLDFIVTEGSPVKFGSNIAAIVHSGILTNIYPELEPAFEISENM
ncbi:hypothetical protein FOA43_004823 [Brettanomyces nanus]|uniref:Amidohydrolase 3 domain-containing protein n=1 Tax=Eeniella nana TaxID=13502 RepID=A0A875SDF2_EENNA|nr:uncharacterized protein FOA43_004823 [Brettanomyces nanus]QPG77409.1 hypothetical protein FOA43_004823 [Brettanomyces nanus]